MSTVITQKQLADLVAELTDLGDRLEVAIEVREKDWHTAARAAAVLESLRLGISTISPAPMVLGFDLAMGNDKSVVEVFHS